MMVFPLPTPLASINGEIRSSREFQWLSSALLGIIFCRIIYRLTDSVSLVCIKEYKKLSEKEKVEWSNRGFSTFHAILAASASLYLLLFSDLFDENSHAELIVNRTSVMSDVTLGFSVGYFLSDLAMIIWYLPALGGLEYVLHHGLSLFAIIQSLLSGQGQIYILMVLFSEITTPFVNLRWHLDRTGKKSSKMYIYNGIALFFGWLVARVILFMYFFTHMYSHFDQVKKIFPLGFYSLLTIPATLALLNLFWFWKIARGLIRTLSKAKKHSQ